MNKNKLFKIAKVVIILSIIIFVVFLIFRNLEVVKSPDLTEKIKNKWRFVSISFSFVGISFATRLLVDVIAG